MVVPPLWTRLRCYARDATLARGHQVQIRDALWFLARQWQVGELTGLDGGSPIDAAYRLEQSPVTAYRPQQGPTESIAVVGEPPLEVRVEREGFSLGLRGAIQLGLRFEALAHDMLGANAEVTIAAVRQAFPVDPAPALDEVPDPRAAAIRAVAASRVTDGWKLYLAAVANPRTPTIPAGAEPAVTAFIGYCSGLYTFPSGASAWNPSDLAFQLTAAVETPREVVGLAARDFPGGHLDWYSFDYQALADAAGNVQPVDTVSASAIPHRISFPGGPGTRWWEFDDGQTNLGDLETELVDLTKMLLAEFAAVATNDWFEFSIPVNVGTLNRLAGLVVTDTFGVRTLIRPTGAIDPPTGSTKAWQMFTVSGDPNRRDTLLLPPTIGNVMDGPVVEDVLLFRDDMAAMCWAIERSLAGPLDEARDAYEAQLVAPPAAAPLPAGVDLNYLVGTSVPKNWIPLVAFVASDGNLTLRRGAMVVPNPPGPPVPVPARSAILTPDRMLLIRDQAIPRAGVQVNRYMRRARWTDGAIYCWMARRVRAGRGQGASGLAFDGLAGRSP